MEYAGLSGRMLLAAILLVAAMGKARSFSAFAIPLRGLGLPRRLADAATAGLIGYEGVLGLLLASGAMPQLTVAAVALLLAVFVAVSAYALASGRQIACNCFGGTSSPLGWRTVARSLLMGLALAISASAPAFTQRLAWPGVVRVTVLAGGLAMAMLLLASWALTLPSLVGLVRGRRQSEYEVGLLLRSVTAPDDQPVRAAEG